MLATFRSCFFEAGSNNSQMLVLSPPTTFIGFKPKTSPNFTSAHMVLGRKAMSGFSVGMVNEPTIPEAQKQ